MYEYIALLCVCVCVCVCACKNCKMNFLCQFFFNKMLLLDILMVIIFLTLNVCVCVCVCNMCTRLHIHIFVNIYMQIFISLHLMSLASYTNLPNCIEDISRICRRTRKASGQYASVVARSHNTASAYNFVIHYIAVIRFLVVNLIPKTIAQRLLCNITEITWLIIAAVPHVTLLH